LTAVGSTGALGEATAPPGEVVNLCFHGIGTPRRALEAGEETFWVSASFFREVLALVRGRHDVRLSFDDGNDTDVLEALPVLERLGLNAEFYLLAGRLDRPGSVRRSDVLSLQGAGMTIGSHGMDHRSWRTVSGSAATEEFVTARDRLEQVTGRPVDTAACPLGEYDRTVLGRLRSSGVRRLMTSDRTRTSPLAWLQPRYSLTRHDTVESVRRLLEDVPSRWERARGRGRVLAKSWR
jgi:peptidoglycan/xylan/chitin deacetylase (PgdA/CDA1 family)